MSRNNKNCVDNNCRGVNGYMIRMETIEKKNSSHCFGQVTYEKLRKRVMNDEDPTSEPDQLRDEDKVTVVEGKIIRRENWELEEHVRKKQRKNNESKEDEEGTLV